VAGDERQLMRVLPAEVRRIDPNILVSDLRTLLAGLVAGVAAAYASGRYVQSQLFGLDADDPFVFGAAVGILLLSAALATLMPALRASRIEVVRAALRIASPRRG